MTYRTRIKAGSTQCTCFHNDQIQVIEYSTWKNNAFIINAITYIMQLHIYVHYCTEDDVHITMAEHVCTIQICFTNNWASPRLNRNEQGRKDYVYW